MWLSCGSSLSLWISPWISLLLEDTTTTCPALKPSMISPSPNHWCCTSAP
jgi:hypothetical protein